MSVTPEATTAKPVRRRRRRPKRRRCEGCQTIIHTLDSIHKYTLECEYFGDYFVYRTSYAGTDRICMNCDTVSHTHELLNPKPLSLR